MDKVPWPGQVVDVRVFAVSYMTGLDLSEHTRADGPKPEMRGPAQAPIPHGHRVKGASSCSHPSCLCRLPRHPPVPVPISCSAVSVSWPPALLRTTAKPRATGTPARGGTGEGREELPLQLWLSSLEATR